MRCHFKGWKLKYFTFRKFYNVKYLPFFFGRSVVKDTFVCENVYNISIKCVFVKRNILLDVRRVFGLSN